MKKYDNIEITAILILGILIGINIGMFFILINK